MRRRITIVGGFYREICQFPQSDEYWGSGGRAATTIADNDVEITLISATNQKSELVLASIAESAGFKYSSKVIGHTILFHWQHGLSTPSIYPPLHTIERAELRASDDCVLVFGMLEAEIEVQASTIIYDPQDPHSPRHIRPNTKPARLAYVLNRSEARQLGNDPDLQIAVNNIFKNSGADVVIVKRGALGPLVFENGQVQSVPAFETHSVWPIGSGDVFAAVFALLWGVERQTSVMAAKTASYAAAEYVETRVLPIGLKTFRTDSKRKELNPQQRQLGDGDYDVYLAGPFFNMSQLWLINEARSALRGLGLKVFSPYHDVGIGQGKDVAPKDIEALLKSRAVFAVIDGGDTGTIFETGYARAHAKPVIALSQSTPEEPLKMISGTGCEVVSDFVSAIYRVAWAAWR